MPQPDPDPQEIEIPRTEKDRPERSRYGRPLTPRERYVWEIHHKYPNKTYVELSNITKTLGSYASPEAVARYIDRARRKLGIESKRELARNPANKLRKNRILKEVKTEILERTVSSISLKFAESLEEMSREDIDALPAKERAIVAGIMLDKRANLRGEPNTRIEITDSRKATEIAAALMQELNRRQMTIDVTPNTSDWADVRPRALEDGET